MKFQPDSMPGTNVITRHAPGELWVGSVRFTHSVRVPWKGDVEPWAPQRIEQLAEQHFAELLALKPEVVLFGSGARLTFVAPGLLRALIDARIGVETMDTAAACRTFNVLASEGRAVVAALLISGVAA